MKLPVLLLALFACSLTNAQFRLVTLGTSTTAGLATSSPDSSWVKRINHYYKYQLAVLDSTYNLGVSGKNFYNSFPTTHIPPPGRPASDPDYNVTRANTLLTDLTNPSHGVVILNFPTGGYDTWPISEILAGLQLIYDSAVRQGNRCFVTTTQPRTDAGFNNSMVKRKLADIKDSILNRFGVANTINFWDEICNRVDSTIAPAYAAGDNVHLNNAGHRLLFERVKAKNIFNLPAPEYRSNVSPTGLWSSASSWQVFDGVVWVGAVDPPSSGSGKITIQSGDSIRINSFTEVDELLIEPTGVLSVFNTTPGTKAVLTLNDGAGADIENFGRLYISSNGIINGNGTLINQPTGAFTLRNRGVLEVNGVNNGITIVNNTGIIRNRTFTNNKTFVLQDFTLQLISSGFVNNDSISITGTGTTFIADSTLAGGHFLNANTGIICRTSATGITNLNASVAVVNLGTVKGLGEYNFVNTTTNTGYINPGNPTGTLKINPGFVTGKSPVISIEISSTGGTQGLHYDNLVFSDVAPTAKNISGSVLRVTDIASDPIGTVYTIVSPASGTIANTFSNVVLGAGLSGPLYNGGNFITVMKTGTLSVSWGEFVAAAVKDKQVQLRWNTIHESNTAYFVVEHSTDGSRFDSIGRQQATGDASVQRNYSFTHSNPQHGRNNLYRIRQVNKDGKYSTSATRAVIPGSNGTSILCHAPTISNANVNVCLTTGNAQLKLIDMSGKMLQSWAVNEGSHSLPITYRIPGAYILAVYKDGKLISSHSILSR
jgi:hypothetical protein